VHLTSPYPHPPAAGTPFPPRCGEGRGQGGMGEVSEAKTQRQLAPKVGCTRGGKGFRSLCKRVKNGYEEGR